MNNKTTIVNALLATLAAIVLLLPGCNNEVTPAPSSPEATVQAQPTGLPAQPAASTTPAPTSSPIQARIVGQWKYDFPQNYDPEIGFVDAITVATATVNGKGYLILSFDPLSGPNNSRVFIFDTENPVSPSLISTIAREKQGRDALLVRTTAVQNNILYAGLFFDKGVWMIDLSHPDSPKDLGIAPVPITSKLIVSGDHAYGSGQLFNGIPIGDISNSQKAREIARIDVVSRDCRLAVSGQRLYIGFQQTLTVVDISVPASPKIISTCELTVPEGLTTQFIPEPHMVNWDKWANIIDLEAEGDYVYVTFGAGQLRVIDVSNPVKPHEVSTVDIGGFAIALTLKDNLLYLTKSDKENSVLRLLVLDISHPENPGLVGEVQTESIFGFGGATFAYCFMRPQIIGNYAYIAGLNYMDVIKIR